ncbi:hypothetical protein BH23PLA1_BH23PLA1_00290 [soil metagenome]
MDDDLLMFLRSRPKPPGQDFRSNPRRGCEVDARIAWKDGSRKHSNPAQLMDIGRFGAALLMHEPPPKGASVRLRIVAYEKTPWIEAEVLEVAPSPDGIGKPMRVRLQFPEPCPTVLLKVAALAALEPVSADSQR